MNYETGLEELKQDLLALTALYNHDSSFDQKAIVAEKLNEGEVTERGMENVESEDGNVYMTSIMDPVWGEGDSILSKAIGQGKRLLYRPGTRADVDFFDGKPYALQTGFKAPDGFDSEDFDEMVDELYSDVVEEKDGYVSESATGQFFEDVLDSIGGTLLEGNGLSDQYVVNDGHGESTIAFFDEEGYVTVNSRDRNAWTRTIDQAEKVSRYLDEFELETVRFVTSDD